MIIPIYINRNFKLPIISKLTFLENVWLWLVIVFMLVIVVLGILTIFGLSWEYVAYTFIIGHIMNMIMFILSSNQK